MLQHTESQWEGMREHTDVQQQLKLNKASGWESNPLHCGATMSTTHFTQTHFPQNKGKLYLHYCIWCKAKLNMMSLTVCYSDNLVI